MKIEILETKTWTPPMVIIDTLLDDRDSGVLPFGESSVMVMSLSDSMESDREFFKMEEGHPRFPGFGRYKEYVNAWQLRTFGWIDPDGLNCT